MESNRKMLDNIEKKLKFIKCISESDKNKISAILTDRIIDIDRQLTSKMLEKNRTIRSLSDELDTGLTIRDIIQIYRLAN